MENGRYKKGRFLSGHPGRKPSGSTELRKKVMDFVEGKWDDVPQWFNSLKAKDKLYFMTELLSFCLPKLRQVEIDGIDLMDERRRIASAFPEELKVGFENIEEN
jgi:hypothetical protein